MMNLGKETYAKLSKRIQFVTRFKINEEKYASENFKVMNYGLGGTIQIHWDSVGNLSSKKVLKLS